MDILATFLAGIALIVGALGIIIPVLPGSILCLIGLLIFAIGTGWPVGWVTFVIGGAIVISGMSASYVLTGRELKRRDIPNRSILIGGILGIVGMFVIPVVGLFVGFALGLYLSEWLRLREAGPAARSALAALKQTGIGMLIEFTCACLAISSFVVGAFIYF